MDAIEISPYQVQLLADRLPAPRQAGLPAIDNPQAAIRNPQSSIVFTREKMDGSHGLLLDMGCPFCSEWIGAANPSLLPREMLLELAKIFTEIHLPHCPMFLVP